SRGRAGRRPARTPRTRAPPPGPRTHRGRCGCWYAEPCQAARGRWECSQWRTLPRDLEQNLYVSSAEIRNPWSGGLAAGFLGLISAPGGRPPPTAQPRGLPGSLLGSLPGGLLRSSLGIAAGLRGGFRRADLAARPCPAPPPPGRAACRGCPVPGTLPVP